MYIAQKHTSQLLVSGTQEVRANGEKNMRQKTVHIYSHDIMFMCTIYADIETWVSLRTDRSCQDMLLNVDISHHGVAIEYLSPVLLLNAFCSAQSFACL